MNLKDELAGRILDIFVAANGDAVAKLLAATHGMVDFRPIADECVRQMQWARMHGLEGWKLTCPHGYDGWTGAHQFCECWGPMHTTSAPDPKLWAAMAKPLTIAPEGWKP